MLRRVAEDRHYCLLVPGLLPVGFLFVLLNWLGLKYFKHN